jgi:6-phosphogluconolactonase
MNWILNEFETDEHLVQELAPRIARALAVSIRERGSASLALSGGRTPVRLFETLSHEPLEWAQVTLLLVDERWVEETDPDSNAHLVREHLLQNKAAAARFLGMKTEAVSPADACAEVSKRYNEAWPLDIVILGIGGDGHTASYHPHSRGTQEALEGSNLVYAVFPAAAPHPRMTLSLSALLAADLRILHLVGEDKRDVLQEAMNEGPVEDMPVRAVLHDVRHPIDIYYAKTGGKQ